MKNTKNADISNIYRLDGQVPIMKAIPFGLQHILAMFVANLTPITIIAGAGGLKQAEIAILLQNAMFVAGIATLIQLYPVWKIGSRLPIVMGVSFTFVTVLSTVAANYGYPAVVGAVMIGGIMEGTLGLLAKYWKKIISPIVAASGLPDLEYKSKRILETAFRFSRPDRRLYRGCFYGKSRSLCYLFRRNHFLPENHAICA